MSATGILIKVSHDSSNVLGFEVSPDTRYPIENYMLGMRASILRVRFRWDQKNYWLEFHKVRYVQGPVTQTGRNLRTSPESECHSLLRETGHHIEEHISFRLFTLDTPTIPIKILADREVYLYEVTKQYFELQDTALLDRIAIDPVTGQPSIVKVRSNKAGEKSVIYHDIAGVLRAFEAGETHEQILNYSSGNLESEDIQACLVYARRAITKTKE